MISNKTYDILKRVLTVVVPAFITLLTALTAAWHWDIPLEAIVATISGVATFLGICLGISTSKYNESQIEFHKEGRSGDEV